METAHFWNKFYLYGKKISVISLLLLSTIAIAQQSQSINYPEYDEKKLNYGFTLGGHYDNFILKHSNSYDPTGSIRELRGSGGSGYTLGFIINYHFNDIVDIRVLPTVGFYERNIQYVNTSFPLAADQEVTELFEGTFIEFPILAKFKSIRRKNHRAYFVAGLKPSIGVGGKKVKKAATEVQTLTRDLSLELGVGTDLYMPFFKFSPELRFSLGLLNMFDNDNSAVSNNLERISSYSVGLYFLFE
ncbi:MAG: porin family protein [Cyclobacteriaceae bacterium]